MGARHLRHGRGPESGCTSPTAARSSAPADVDLLFEPFRRGGKVRTATRGSGLGLSIVRLIVEAHHGRLQAAAPPFGGLAIRIDLPGAEPDREVTPAQSPAPRQ